jgi:hypothetical protein
LSIAYVLLAAGAWSKLRERALGLGMAISFSLFGGFLALSFSFPCSHGYANVDHDIPEARLLTATYRMPGWLNKPRISIDEPTPARRPLRFIGSFLGPD